MKIPRHEQRGLRETVIRSITAISIFMTMGWAAFDVTGVLLISILNPESAEFKVLDDTGHNNIHISKDLLSSIIVFMKNN